MRIELANRNTRFFVRKIWKDVFGDSDSYMDLFFSEKYKDENTLVAIEEGRGVAALQMLPYEIIFYGVKVPFYYLTGLSTLPEYRNRGLMTEMIVHSHQLMRERGIPLSILIPAEESLFGYYERFGYAQTFAKHEMAFELSLKEICEVAKREEESYALFDKIYNRHDFCVQKSFSDFKVVVKEASQENYPDKTNLWGVSRIIDAKGLLSVYAKANPQHDFRVRVQDALFGDTILWVKEGDVNILSDSYLPDFSMTERGLTQLLFGFEVNAFPKQFALFFEEHTPIMNYMLE